MSEPITITILAAIFAGAFFDAMIVTCLFVFGEAVFLLAGGLAYTTGSPLPVLAAYAGAYSADQTSYGFGYFFRSSFNRFALATSARRKIARRAKKLLNKCGVVTITLSRFMGPIAWITPPLAGSLSMAYSRFAIGSLIGVLLGVGQFLLLGWISAYAAAHSGYDPRAFLAENFWTLFLIGQGTFLGLVLLWRLARAVNQRQRSAKE